MVTLVTPSTHTPGAAWRRSPGTALAFTLALLAAPFTSAAEKDPTEQLAELQALLLGYADSYMSAIAQATDEVREADPDNPRVRVIAHNLLLHAALSVNRIAIGSNPEINLLDMMVFATLMRSVYETPKAKEVYGKNRDIILSTMRKLEKEIWDIGTRYLSREELAELGELIKRWQAENPQLLNVFYVRLSDFASQRSKSKLLEKSREKGFLVDLSGTEKAVDEIRLLAERALYMSERMPLIIEWHMQSLLYNLALEPEVQRLLEQSTDVTKSMDRLTAFIEKLPDRIATERKATITGISRELAEERNDAILQMADVLATERRATVEDVHQALASERMALFAEIDTRQKMLKGTLSEVRAGIADADKLTLSLGNTTAVINEALQNADKLMAHFEKAPGEPGEPFDIGSYTEAIRELTVALKEANTLVLSTERLTAKDLPTQAVFDQVLKTGALLIVILCVAVFITMLLYRAAARHIVPRSGFER